MKMRILLAAVMLSAFAAPAGAQSLFATRGLGVPVTSLDGRAAILGGVGVGLIGFHSSLANPAELAGTFRKGVTAALQPVTSSMDIDGAEDGTSSTRFPMLMVTYPINPRLSTALGFGGYLDQSWAVSQDGLREVNGVSVPVTDLLRSSGGIAQIKFNASYMLTPGFAVGLGGGLLTGNVERLASRTFNDDTTGSLANFEQRLRWRFKAPIATVGARWDVGGIARIGASITAGGDIKAYTVGDSVASEDRKYSAPLQVAAGTSVRLSNLLLAAGGVTWDRVPTVGNGTENRETIRVGGGLEYEGLRSGLRTYPLRIGARWGQLPYYLTGEEAAKEWSAGLGLGFRLGNPQDPSALADIGIERGSRSGLAGTAVPGGVSEKLWRFTVSLSLFAN
jgi:long-subunit fatty acid transport protein